MSSSKIIHLLRDFAAGVYLSEAPSLFMTPHHPPLPYTLYTCILIHTGKGCGDGGKLTGEKVRGARLHKAGSKKTTVSPVYKLR
jgi:hypothetical protein